MALLVLDGGAMVLGSVQGRSNWRSNGEIWLLRNRIVVLEVIHDYGLARGADNCGALTALTP